MHQGLISLSYFSYILDKEAITSWKLKLDKGRLTPEQKARVEEIRAAGGIAEIIKSIEDVHRLFGNGRIEISPSLVDSRLSHTSQKAFLGII